MCNDEYRELAAALTDGAGRAAASSCSAAHVVDRVAAGGRWHCADGCGTRGTVDDPSASPLAVAAVLDGRRLYARRAELQAGRSKSIDPAAQRRAGRCRSATASRMPARRPDADARARRRSGHRRGRRGWPTARNSATTSWRGWRCALTDPRVRDTLYALAVGENAGQAESLWALLSRTLPAAVAGRGACAAGVLGLRARRRPAGRRVAGGGAALRPDAPDGGHARHRAAVGHAARTDPRSGA